VETTFSREWFFPASDARFKHVHVSAVCCRAIVEVFSAAANQKPVGNKDLCTRNSVKRTLKRVRVKRLA